MVRNTSGSPPVPTDFPNSWSPNAGGDLLSSLTMVVQELFADTSASPAGFLSVYLIIVELEV